MLKLLTDKEAAAFLGISPGALRSWRFNGVGPQYFKLGGAVRYDPADLTKFLRESRVDPAEEREKIIRQAITGERN